MAQSNESKLRRITALWSKQTMEPPHSWTYWSDQFQLAIIAKDNLDIDILSGPEVPENRIPILKQPTGIESENRYGTSQSGGKKKECNEILRSRQGEENKRQKKKIQRVEKSRRRQEVEIFLIFRSSK